MQPSRRFHHPELEVLEDRLPPGSLDLWSSLPDATKRTEELVAIVASGAAATQHDAGGASAAAPKPGLYGALAAQWWQWALTAPVDAHPLLDDTGANAAVGQQGKYWFLGGSFASSTVTRDITVPAGKSLFFPVVNEVYLKFPGETTSKTEMLQNVIAPTDTASVTDVTIDGVSQGQAALRTLSPFFYTKVEAGTLLDGAVAVGAKVQGVSDGYYVLLNPLPVGQHTIHFAGEIPFDGVTLDVTYHITVAPRH